MRVCFEEFIFFIKDQRILQSEVLGKLQRLLERRFAVHRWDLSQRHIK